jgi:ribosomal protein S6--L-glutamate ligase
VDLLRAHDGPKVLEVNSSPGFEGIEKAARKNLAATLYAEIERHAGRTRLRAAPLPI